jgi:hypothetical protein
MSLGQEEPVGRGAGGGTTTAASALPKHKRQSHLARRLQGKRRNAEEKRMGTGNEDRRGLVACFLK